MRQLFANNASALLAASIDDVETTIQVASGFGTLYPDPGVDEFFLVTLENDDGDIEICRVTARSTDLFTVTRGQEGTTAQSWTQGQTRVELRSTKETLDAFIQREGDTMEGDLDMDENELQNAHLTGAGTKILAGEIVNVPLRGVSGGVGNQITVPTNGTSRAQAGGENIVVAGDIEQEAIQTLAFAIGQVILWYGAAGDIPDGWARCDGDNGTPDLRGRFVIGAEAPDYTFDAEGGAASVTSGAGGAHTPTIQGTAITAAQMPSHKHFMAVAGIDSDPLSATLGLAEQTNAGNNSEYTLKGKSGTPTIGLTSAQSGGSGSTHTHTADAVATHTHTVATLPPYKALHYIMFVGF